MKSSEFIKNNPELVEKAKECKTKEDFITLAKKNSIEFEDMSLEMAYDFLHGEEGLSEDSLEAVAGGKGTKSAVGNTFSSISKDDAMSASKKGKPIVYLDPGFYEVNGSIRKFKGGYYLVSE